MYTDIVNTVVYYFSADINTTVCRLNVEIVSDIADSQTSLQ